MKYFLIILSLYLFRKRNGWLLSSTLFLIHAGQSLSNTWVLGKFIHSSVTKLRDIYESTTLWRKESNLKKKTTIKHGTSKKMKGTKHLSVILENKNEKLVSMKMNLIFPLFLSLLLSPKEKKIWGMLSCGETSRDNLYKIDMGVVKPLRRQNKMGSLEQNQWVCDISILYSIYMIHGGKGDDWLISWETRWREKTNRQRHSHNCPQNKTTPLNTRLAPRTNHQHIHALTHTHTHIHVIDWPNKWRDRRGGVYIWAKLLNSINWIGAKKKDRAGKREKKI